MSVVGKPRVGARAVELARDWKSVTRYSFPAAGLLPKLSAYLDGLGTGDELAALTFGGNEITDLVRQAKVQGDGRTAPDFSTGIWEGVVNPIANPSFEGSLASWTRSTVAVTFDGTTSKFAGGSCKISSLVYDFAYQDVTLAIGTHVFSVWRKSLNHTSTSPATVQIEVPGGSTAVISTRTTLDTLPQGNLGTRDWERVMVQITVTTAGVCRFLVSNSYGGTGSGTIWFDGAQVDPLKTLATPFVVGTRNQTAPTAPASLLNVTQGWVAMRVRMGWGAAAAPNVLPRAFVWQDGAGTVWIRALYNQSVKNWALDRQGGTTVGSPVLSFNAGDFATLVFAWTATQVKISVGGAAFSVAANSSIPAGLPSTFVIGDSVASGGNRSLDGDIVWLACGTGTLTDADPASFAALTKPANLAALPSRTTSLPTMLWKGQTPNYRVGSLTLGPESLKPVLYDAAGNLVAVGDEITVNAGDAPAWRDLTFSGYPGGVPVSAAAYDVGLIAGGAGSHVARVYTDSVGQGQTLGDTYSDGPSLLFGTGWPTLDDLSVYGVSFAAWVPPTELEAWYARLPWELSQRVLSSTSPVAASASLGEVAWHGTRLDSERGAFAVAQRGGRFDALVGERVRVSLGQPTRAVYLYVHDVADIEHDLSLPRRAFQELAELAVDWVEATITRMA